jgi:hypothetical protein
MLFDVRGRGRRRVVRVVYIGLALLFLLGFVGLGVGSFGGGGILSSLSSNEGSSSTSFSSQIKKYKKLTEQQPNNISAWEGLTKNLLHEGSGEAYVTSTGAVTSKGKTLFSQTAQAWSGYIALNPPKPSLELAKEMLRIYGAEGLDQASQAVQVLQLIIAAEPSNASYYAQLAEYAYKAKNTGLGDLSSEKAVSLAPASEKTRVKSELAEVKRTLGSEKTYTTTTNGKTYAGKLNSKGEVAAKEVKTVTAPAGSSTNANKK